MSTYPTNPRSAFVEWCATHAGVFQAEEAAIGLSKAQAVAFAGATGKAESLLLEQAEAWARYLVASQRVRDGVALLRREAGDCVRSIRAFAETTGDANKIYASARIAAPKSPSPAAPPDRPRQLAATLNATTGALTLTWKARDPNRRGGVTYLVRRRLPGEAVLTLLGVTGQKTFVDATLPAGVASVEYTVQSQRGRRVGTLSAVLLVNVGRPAAPARPATKTRLPEARHRGRPIVRSADRGLRRGNAATASS